MKLKFIPLIAALLPFGAINLAYWIAVNDGDLVGCLPYVDGCTSISATGRHDPSKYVFRAAMLPQSVVMMLYWVMCYQWLRLLDQPGSGKGTRRILISGLVSSFFLILYATFLGSEGDFYELMRRYGVTVYFAFAYLGQLLMVAKHYELIRKGRIARIPLLPLQLIICVVMLLLGLVSIPVGNFLENKNTWQNIIEWNFALLMHLYFFCTYFGWRDHKFSAGFSVETQAKSQG